MSIKTKTPPGILFAEDFGDEGVAAPIIVTELEKLPDTTPLFFAKSDVDEARKAAHLEGYKEGKIEATAQTAMTVATTLSQIANQIQQSQSAADASIERAIEACCQLLFETLAALLPSLCARHDPSEIAHIVRMIMRSMTPDIVVSVGVSPSFVDDVRTALAEYRPDLSSRVVITAQNGMEAGEARLTWENGSARRHPRLMIVQVNEILTQFGLLDQSVKAPPCLDASAWQPTTNARPHGTPKTAEALHA